MSAELMSNPLCGIGTYKDILNLATGDITRKIKKLVLQGTEDWYVNGNTFYMATMFSYLRTVDFIMCICTHYPSVTQITVSTEMPNNAVTFNSTVASPRVYINDTNYNDVDVFKSYLAQQYTNGTPVTLWFVLATSETEQITVPSGLSGTVEGYLIQDGTPTPQAPIYPTANTAKGWYDINAYKRSVLVWNTDTAYERSDGSWT